MYNEISDSELLQLIEENHEEALTELIERYNPTINAIVSKYKSRAIQIGLEVSDLYQEGLIGLINAIKSYNKDKEAAFKTYATLLIERTIIDLMKINSRTKYKTLNSAVSIDNFSEDETLNLYNIIEDNNTPEKTIITKEAKEELKKVLADFELKVYELKEEGKTNNEIALILDKTLRSIENTLQRIKQKIKQKDQYD